MTTKTTDTNDRQTITLETPIKRGDTQIEQLVIRKPCGSELRGTSLFGVARMDADAIMTLIPRISEPPLISSEVLRMDPADLVQVGVFLAEQLVPKSLQAAAQEALGN